MNARLAIITARGGSKRIPRKNIREFLGKPIIAYGIEAALSSQLFDEVMVSTDDEEIAAISRDCGASLPFMRSQKNSDDFATTAEVLIEVLNMYIELGHSYMDACCIYPTAPFVTPQKLQDAYRLMIEKGYDSVSPVVPFGFPILRAVKMEDGKVSPVWPEHFMKRSQDLNPTFHDAGQFYWFRVEHLLECGQIHGENSGGIIVDEMTVQDIDTEADWKLAELKFKLLLS